MSANDKSRKAIEEIGNGMISVNCYNCDLKDEDAKTIANALKNNKTLKTLCLWSNKITDEGAIALADALKDNKTLLELRLADNRITDIGVSALADRLKINNTLQVLGLSGNKITDSGAISLARLVFKNDVLKELCLRDNHISDAGMIAMAKSLVGNIALTRFDIFGNSDITDTSVPALKHMIQTSHVIKMKNNFQGTSISRSAQKKLVDLLAIPIENRQGVKDAKSSRKRSEKRTEKRKEEDDTQMKWNIVAVLVIFSTIYFLIDDEIHGRFE